MPSNSTETARIPVDVRRFPWIRRLAADYAFNFNELSGFFSGNPADPGAWADAVSRAQSQPRERAAISSIVAAQQARRAAPAAALEAGRLLADPRTVAVVTGQQAGLFGGPMFTLLKAITAVKLAGQVAQRHRVPAVAVFWIDGEDHDWNEVRSCSVFDEALTARAISLPERDANPTPVASVRFDATIDRALEELEAALPATEFRAPLLADLRRIYRPGVGMAEAFGQWLERVLGEKGLVVYDASDPAAKPLASGVFTRELSSGQTGRLAATAGAELVSRGFHAQVDMHEDAVALFHMDGGRRPIRRYNGQFTAGDRTLPGAALLSAASERPAEFSPNVLLRPIVQDTLFPTVSYVAGPNELAYLAQLRAVYEHFGTPMPLMHQRASATIVDSAALRFLIRYDVPLEALQAQDEAALNELLKAQLPPAVEASFESAARAIEAEMTKVAGAVPAVDPTLEGAAKSTLGRMQHDLQTLRNKMIQAAKRRDETLRRQFTRTRSLVFPDGHPQEREIGFVSFLNQFGPAFVERLSEELPTDMGTHWVIAI